MMRSLVVALSASLVSCASQPPPEAEVPKPVPEPAAEPNHPPRDTALASEALRALPADATVVIRIDGNALRKGPAFGLLTALGEKLPPARQGLAIVQAACGLDALKDISEIAIGGQHRFDQYGPVMDEEKLVAAIGLSKPASDVVGCLSNFLPVSEEEIGGHPATRVPTGAFVAARGQLLLYASRDSLARAHTRLDDAASLAPPVQALLDDNPHASAIAYATGANPWGLSWVSFSGSQGPGEVELRSVAVAESAEAARSAADAANTLLASAKRELSPFGENGSMVSALLDDVRVDVRDKSLSAWLTIPGSQSERLFSEVLVSLVTEGVNQYTMAAKTAEARDRVMRIALALSDHARAHRKGARFPVSAPRSPPQIPKGKSQAIPGAFDHPSWKAIGFSVVGSSYYSYSFERAKDGQSAVVVAEGDLDGDGISSRYSVTVRMEGNEPKIDERIQSERPYE